MNKVYTLCLFGLLLVSCRAAETRTLKEFGEQSQFNSKAVASISEIELSRIGRIAPKGRVQDKEYNRLKVIEQLLEHGKESIPYLINKLDDETKIKGQVVDYWSEVSVGDVAHIILTDFFTDSSQQKTTITGLGWNEFLGGEGNSNLTGEQRLREHIAKHGRKSLKSKWRLIWEENKDRIYWDEAERCFKVTAL